MPDWMTTNQRAHSSIIFTLSMRKSLPTSSSLSARRPRTSSSGIASEFFRQRRWSSRPWSDAGWITNKLTENDTVVAVAHDFPASFENILRVLPLTKTIAIVNGASPNETILAGGAAAGTRATDGSGRIQMVHRAVVRRHSEGRSQSSTSQRHLLASDERRCGRRCARGQQCFGQAFCHGQRADFLVP